MKTRVAWIVLCAFVAFVAVERPHLDRHWGLYVLAPAQGTGQRGERLFLDPFPDQVACDLEAHNMEFEGEPAVCHSSISLAWGSSADRTLAADFSGANLLYNLYCTLRGLSARPRKT